MGAAASREEEAQHRSVHSKVATIAEFTNRTQYSVRAEWLDYRGRPKVYVVLRPGETYRQHTYCSHPWRFKVEDSEGTADDVILVSDQKQVVYFKPEEDCVSITEAAAVPWSPSSAAQFPLSFQRQVQAVLLCHQRWQMGSSAQESERVSLACCSRRLLASSLSGLRGLGRLGYKAPPARPEEEQPSGSCTLGCLPKEVLLVVLQLAAPYVPYVLKPEFPPGAEDGDFTLEERSALFRSGMQEGAAP